MKVTIVDYGVGNLLSAARALGAVGGDVELATDPARVAAAERLVLPGVGAFGNCMAELRRQSLVEPVLAFARTGRPMLGICVGMQILMEYGEEFGRHEGLGLVAGHVARLSDHTPEGGALKLPHIGWNELLLPRARNGWEHTICAGLPESPATYFVHSFSVRPTDDAARLAEAEYGGQRLVAALSAGAISGTQFHPEKSGPVGLAILSNFLAK
ncbi:MAG: imidazole glycerol phosphate synthase subunit HisH [Proteobacteria bacterium]|nr:imidazole glycerol phosphate synthase subunit HisH [Pseudomonadota bacterium]